MQNVSSDVDVGVGVGRCADVGVGAVVLIRM